MADSVTDTWPDLVGMLLTGRVIGPLAGMVIGGLAGSMTGICVETLAKVCTTAVVVVAITLEGVAPVSNTNVRAGTVFDTEASIVARVDVMGDDLIDSLTRTTNDAVPDIGVLSSVDTNTWVSMIAVLEFITLPVLLEGLLLF